MKNIKNKKVKISAHWSHSQSFAQVLENADFVFSHTFDNTYKKHPVIVSDLGVYSQYNGLVISHHGDGIEDYAVGSITVEELPELIKEGIMSAPKEHIENFIADWLCDAGADDLVIIPFDEASKYLYEVRQNYIHIGTPGNYAIKIIINPLVKRYENGERSLDLYNAIMKLQ